MSNMDASGSATYEGVSARLSEILDLVSDENTSLDEALVLYEEAVKLGLAACDLSEQDLETAIALENDTEEGQPSDG